MPENFFVVSKEYPLLAIDEVESIAKSYDRFSKIQSFSNLVIIHSKTPWEKIAKRATFVKIAGVVIGNLSDLISTKYFGESQNETFSCRVVNLSSKTIAVPKIEKMMGSLISKILNSKVALKNPSRKIYLIITDTKSFFGISNEFEKFERPKKVSKHPHELDWKLSRAMINLAGLKEGDTICDPFCGTGTTLLEAESMGISSIGIDFDKKMSDISKKNLEANGYKPRVYNSDYQYHSRIQNNYDGLVTDLPYGKSSKSSKDPAELIKEFASKIPKRKKLVMMFKKEIAEDFDFKPTKKYQIYRHRSLTRMILVK